MFREIFEKQNTERIRKTDRTDGQAQTLAEDWSIEDDVKKTKTTRPGYLNARQKQTTLIDQNSPNSVDVDGYSIDQRFRSLMMKSLFVDLTDL